VIDTLKEAQTQLKSIPEEKNISEWIVAQQKDLIKVL
jgi:hypothetical protein